MARFPQPLQDVPAPPFPLFSSETRHAYASKDIQPQTYFWMQRKKGDGCPDTRPSPREKPCSSLIWSCVTARGGTASFNRRRCAQTKNVFRRMINLNDTPDQAKKCYLRRPYTAMTHCPPSLNSTACFLQLQEIALPCTLPIFPISSRSYRMSKWNPAAIADYLKIALCQGTECSVWNSACRGDITGRFEAAHRFGYIDQVTLKCTLTKVQADNKSEP